MIKSEAIWTRKPAKASLASLEQKETQATPSREANPKQGFLQTFQKMLEVQTDLMIRNLRD